MTIYLKKVAVMGINVNVIDLFEICLFTNYSPEIHLRFERDSPKIC